MANIFVRGDRFAGFSNGATLSLYRALLALGARRAVDGDPDGRAVASYLRREVGKEGAVSAFSLDPPLPPLDTPERLRILAELVADFLRELTDDHPDRTLTDVEWDRELRLRWIGSLMEIHDMIVDVLPPEARPDPVQLSLTVTERAEIEADRLYARYHRADHAGDKERAASLIDPILAALRAAGAEERSALKMNELLVAKAHYLVDTGRSAEGIALLREVAARDPDPESARETRELADDLEHEGARAT